MSTEYTLVRTCQVSGDRSSLPLGVSYASRRFKFRAHRTLGLVNFDAVIEFIKRDDAEVFDEYGRHIPLAKFVDFAQASLATPDQHLRDYERNDIRFASNDERQRRWVDARGHSFATDDFF